MEQYKILARTLLSEWAGAFRKRLGLSQEEMAERLRISSRAYRELERGRFCFSAFALLMLLSLLSSGERDDFFLDFITRLNTLEQSEGV